MTMQTGDAVTEAHYQSVMASPLLPAVIRDEFVPPMRAALTATMQPGVARNWPAWDAMPEEAQRLGVALHQAGIAAQVPLAAAAYNSISFNWRYDRVAPEGATTVEVVLRDGPPRSARATGGMLVFATWQRAFRMLDEEYVCYPSQEWQGMTPLHRNGGYRISVTFFVV